MDTFTMDPIGLKKLERFFKGFPREMRQASAGILNSLAFQTRKYDIENISADMVIRDPKFTRDSLKVQTTAPRRIEEQVAYAGSINRPRFTGWKEAETGATSATKKRGTTRAARGGNKHAIMRREARMRGTGKFKNVDNYRGHTREIRFHTMLSGFIRRGGGGAFILSKTIQTKHGHLPRGLWFFGNHKLQLLQYFGVEHMPKKIHWSRKSIVKLHERNDIQKIYTRQLERIIAKYNK
jgi:hypothetical protein